jgi:citrate lyase beta subunit
MVSSDELEGLILARLKPTVHFCADTEAMLETHAGDLDAKDRVRKLVAHVRREASAFAVRVESSGPFPSAADVERVMRREFDVVASAQFGVLDVLERLVERRQLADV